MKLSLYIHVLLVCCVAGVPQVFGHELEMILMVSSAAQFDTSGVIPVVDLALEMVNNWSLPFNLSYTTILDSQVCAK